MAHSRLELQTILENLLGSRNVYFNPPESIKLNYPCIVYTRSNDKPFFGDNIPYKRMKRWTITVIDRDPDSEIPDKIADLPTCVYDRHFVSDNLHHDVFQIYF